MRVTYRDKTELASYQLKDIARVWFTQWKDFGPVELGLLEWEECKEAFLERYFPRVNREVDIEDFINLRKGNMSLH